MPIWGPNPTPIDTSADTIVPLWNFTVRPGLFEATSAARADALDSAAVMVPTGIDKLSAAQYLFSSRRFSNSVSLNQQYRTAYALSSDRD